MGMVIKYKGIYRLLVKGASEIMLSQELRRRSQMFTSV